MADRYLLPFPWTSSPHRRGYPSASHRPVAFLPLLWCISPLPFLFARPAPGASSPRVAPHSRSPALPLVVVPSHLPRSLPHFGPASLFRRPFRGGGGGGSFVPTGLPNIFSAEGAGNFFSHNNSPHSVDPPPPCEQGSQCKGKLKSNTFVAKSVSTIKQHQFMTVHFH